MSLESHTKYHLIVKPKTKIKNHVKISQEQKLINESTLLNLNIVTDLEGFSECNFNLKMRKRIDS